MRVAKGLFIFFGVLSINACSSSDSSAPATTATDDCGALQKQCEACSDGTLKQACLTSVIQYKSGGDTGQKACKNAIEQKTYSGDECANQCTVLKKQCDTCMNATAK